MPQVPERAEGCWAWVVLLASLVTQGLTLGFPTCTGIFFTELQHEFQASNSETSWFPSILTAMLHAGGPLCSILVGRFGCRVTVMLGGALASLGMVASSFCRTLSQLYLTAGFITGLGMCFSFQSSITVLGFYFSRHRALANALASVGVSLGITLWPLLSRYLLEDLGWRGTFLVFGGVFLHCCVCGAILRPVATSMAPETIEGPPPPSKTPAPGCLAACGRAIQRHLAFDILRHNAGYRVFTLGVMWMILGFPLPHVFLVPYAMRNGVDEHKAALLISIIGFSNIFLRPMAGLVAGRRDFAGHRKYLFSLAALLNGLTNLVCAVSADFRVLVGYCLVYSVSMSGIGALLFQVLMDIVPMDRFSSALGLFTILESISILISPPLAGLLLDTTNNNFSYVFYMSSFFLISAALFMGGSFCALQKKERQSKQAEAEGAITEAASEQGLTVEDSRGSRKQLYTEIMYVTSVFTRYSRGPETPTPTLRIPIPAANYCRTCFLPPTLSPPLPRAPSTALTMAQKPKVDPHVGRLGYLQALVTEFQETESQDAKEQVLANLANFAYDPGNYEYLRQLQVLDLFLDSLSEENETLVEFAIGLIPMCVDILAVFVPVLWPLLELRSVHTAVGLHTPTAESTPGSQDPGKRPMQLWEQVQVLELQV
ncbi:monocarboxylate transporter 6-like [Canis lupus baileyi]|nr:monocarboxylate transporter 6 [Canis lupus familiaris]XP_038405416.1 monocarboxylate transporter 6 [Canis lupus familiaris]XP_038531203.1 monocarboxylate transporter 6 [Canis lupus familiaris]XP_048969717.1 monocarboxylate transporter 6 [Canis lupus dingo]|eukprot:XP_022279605.1 monocarboxylate transporter 6 [Canis lupus familiaris]